MAVVLDATASGFQASGTSLTYSHICTGSNRILTVGIQSDKTISSVTYNGTAMTFINISAGSQPVATYYLVAPSSGTNSVVVTIATTGYIIAASISYTGAKQSGQPDANNSGSVTSTSITTSVTSVADNCIAVLYARDDTSGDTNASTGSTERLANTGFLQIYDNGSPKTPAGAISMSVTTSSGTHALTTSMFTIAPSVASSVNSNFLAFM